MHLRRRQFLADEFRLSHRRPLRNETCPDSFAGHDPVKNNTAARHHSMTSGGVSGGGGIRTLVPRSLRSRPATCLSAFLISAPPPGSGTLRRSPVVFISKRDQRPNHESSPLFSADESRASSSCRGCLVN